MSKGGDGIVLFEFCRNFSSNTYLSEKQIHGKMKKWPNFAMPGNQQKNTKDFKVF